MWMLFGDRMRHRTASDHHNDAEHKGVTPTYEQISQRAQEIWTKKGCLPGQDEQNWLEAERQLKAELARK